jgi:hypothetical protein
MQYNKEFCKLSDNQIVFPIKDFENIGNSLSSINYNFRALDIYTCNFEFSAVNIWNNMFNFFTQNSAVWTDAMNTVRSSSSCWTDTFNTVNTLSALWLKPISLIYPYPFNGQGDGSDIIATVTSWVNNTLPVFSGSCYNFVAGQELFLFTPMYTEINRILSQTKVTGVKYITTYYTCYVIGRGSYTGSNVGTVDCGSQRLDVQIPDRTVDQFAGMRFIVDANTSKWAYDSALYN